MRSTDPTAVNALVVARSGRRVMHVTRHRVRHSVWPRGDGFSMTAPRRGVQRFHYQGVSISILPSNFGSGNLEATGKPARCTARPSPPPDPIDAFRRPTCGANDPDAAHQRLGPGPMGCGASPDANRDSGRLGGPAGG
jgi:hypothetical protein